MPRKHLTELEVDKLIKAAKTTRMGTRNVCLIMLMFRHGLRVSEATNMELSQVDVASHVLHVQRLKNGFSTVHPLRPDEIKVINAWMKDRKAMELSESIKTFFVSERKRRMDRTSVNQLLESLSKIAELPLVAHPHMLRHACGYALADQGIDTRLIQDFLGHKNIQNTVIYTAANSARFERIWK